MLAPVLDLLDEIEACDPGHLTADEALTWLATAQQCQSRLAAIEARGLVAIAGTVREILEVTVPSDEHHRDRTLRIEDAIAEEVAAALRIAPRTARSRIDSARQLVGPLKPLHDELLAGNITVGHAAAIAREAARLPRAVDGTTEDADGVTDPVYAEHCRRLLELVLPFARTHTPGESRRKARAVIERIDPAGADRRRDLARSHQDITVWDDVDGQSVLTARMSTPDAYAVMSAINGLAHDEQFEAPAACTIGQRRVEALKALVLTHAASAGVDDPVASARTTAHIGVVVSLEAMLGLRDEPASLEGSGPISASAARDVVSTCGPDSTMYRLVVDPDGVLLDVGRRRYEVSDVQRAFIVARDVTCRFPGCAARAVACQIDHAVPWDDGGPSDVINLGALCVRHHQLKTHADWKITATAEDGSCTWRSPLGRDYRREPAFATA